MSPELANYLENTMGSLPAATELKNMLDRGGVSGQPGVVASGLAGVAIIEKGTGAIHRTVISLTNFTLPTTDNGVNGAQGSAKLYDFPAGAIQVLGASYNLTTLKGSAAITDTAALVGGVGSAAAGAGDATLTGTEQDLIPSTVGTLAAGAGTLKKHGSLVATAFDGTTTALDAFLNVAIPDAGSTGNSSVIINGTIEILWTNLGDY